MIYRAAACLLALVTGVAAPATAQAPDLDRANPAHVLEAFAGDVSRNDFGGAETYAYPGLQLPDSAAFNPLDPDYSALLALKACALDGVDVNKVRFDGIDGLLVGRVCTLDDFAGAENVDVLVEMRSMTDTYDKPWAAYEWAVEEVYTRASGDEVPDYLTEMLQRRAAQTSPALAVADFFRALKNDDLDGAQRASVRYFREDVKELMEDEPGSFSRHAADFDSILACAEHFSGTVEIVRNPDHPFSATATACFGAEGNWRPVTLLVEFEEEWGVSYTRH